MATKKTTKAPAKKEQETVLLPEKEKIYAKFDFKFGGKLYKKGDCLEVFDGDAKRLCEKGFATTGK